MKKLVKKTLDELAEIMPVLSEKNQHECVGGVYFVGATGNYLGQNTLWDDRIMVLSDTDDLNAFWAAQTNGTLSTFIAGSDLDYGTWATLTSEERIAVYCGLESGSASGFQGSSSYDCLVIDDNTKPAIYIDSSDRLVFNEHNGQLMDYSNVSSAWNDFLSGFELP